MPYRNGRSDKKYILALRKGDRSLVKEQLGRVWDRLDSDLASLKLQHAEYLRRFDILNHAHETAQEVAHTYVTLDKYDQYVAQSREAITLALAAVNDKMSAMEDRLLEKLNSLDLTRAGDEKRSEGLAQWYGWIVGAVGILIALVTLALKFKGG